MIVYAEEREAPLADALSPSLLAAERLRASPESGHAEAVELLAELGELEAAVADAACPEEDAETGEALRLRHAMENVGRLVHATWRGDAAAALAARDRACAAVLSLGAAPLPRRLHPGHEHREYLCLSRRQEAPGPAARSGLGALLAQERDMRAGSAIAVDRSPSRACRRRGPRLVRGAARRYTTALREALALASTAA